MSAAESFMTKFDEQGRFRDGDGVLDVVLMTSGGSRCPAKLHFRNGLCIRAEMEGGGPWAYPDNSPLNQIRFILDFEGEAPRAVCVDQGRIFHHLLEVLQPYPPMTDEATRVAAALGRVTFPSWVVNWDYEFGADEEGSPAVWVNVFAVEGAPRREFGRFALQITPQIWRALSTEGVNRWPYVRLRTAAEHKTA
jgi:hypothetical protein